MSSTPAKPSAPKTQAEMEDRRIKEKERFWLDSLIQADQLHDFYGTITIRLEKGHIRHMSREQTLKPPKED